MTELRDRIAALSPEQRAVLEARLASMSAAKGGAPKERIEPRDRDLPAPVSYAQQREWALERFRPSNNIGGALRLQGRVDLELLSRVLTEVMARHEVLRTTLDVVEGQLVQVVHPVTPIPVAVEDISALDPDARRVRIRQCHDDEVLRPFDPAAPQRMRATALRLSDEEYVAVMSTHHASADGWSMAIVLREVALLYPAFREGLPSPLPDPEIQYGDFAVWQRRHLDDAWMAKELGWWRRTLADLPPRLALPFDKPYPARRTFEGHHYSLTIEGERNLALQKFAEGEGVAISMVLLALCSTVLHRYTGQQDQVFGTAVTGRVRTETEHVVGCFANALPLRIRLSGNDSLVDVLRKAKDVFSSAFDHQEIPFDTLVEELAPRETSQVPLIQMMINVLTTPGDILRLEDQVLEMPGLRVTPLAMDPGWVPVDLILNVQVQPDRVSLQWHYGSELFDDRTVIGLADRVQHTLDQLLAAPDTRVSDVDLMLEEKTEARSSGGATVVDSGSGSNSGNVPAAAATVVGLFQEQADLAPTAAAVVCGATTLSYAELNRQANRLAHRLRALGVGPDTPAGILLDRTPLLPTAVLAVLKAGGAFLPLDTAYPPEHIAATLTDSGAPVLLTTAVLAPLADAAGIRTLLLDDPESFEAEETDLPSPPRAAHAAYLIYTSGSTGRPKGVVVEHGSLTVFAREVADHLRLGPADRFLQFASPGFDVLVEELFPVWLAGGAVVIPPEPVAGIALDVIELAERDHITVMELPAAFWHEWVREIERTGRELPAGLRTVIVGAERVLPERLRTWRGFGRPLVHVYGITETTVSSTFFTLKPSSPDADLQHLPIGTPLPSARLRILDDALRPVPPGAVGELYIGGISVARGYHDRFGLTSERFIADPDPACHGARAYRTGDLVRRRPDGNLEFVARADTQIKIRGYRVEPAEIESALCRHPQVAQAVVTIYEAAPDDRRLTAYIVPQPRTRPNITDLRRFLGRELPPYLVPSAFVHMESIPVTDNGKIDRDRLPAPSEERPDIAEEMVPPETPLEELLAGIVGAVLGITQVGTNDNFFELGGDSILAIQVVARAQEQGVGLSPLDLFELPTVQLLAAKAESAENTDARGQDQQRTAEAPPVPS